MFESIYQSIFINEIDWYMFPPREVLGHLETVRAERAEVKAEANRVEVEKRRLKEGLPNGALIFSIYYINNLKTTFKGNLGDFMSLYFSFTE